MIVLTTAALLAAIGAAGAAAHRSANRPKYIDRFAWAVAVCETGKGHNHPDFRHHTSSYGGAWGWFIGTWKLDRYTRTWRDKHGRWRGMPLYPWNATPRQQYRVFLRGRALGRYWGCIAGGGYRAWD